MEGFSGLVVLSSVQVCGFMGSVGEGDAKNMTLAMNSDEFFVPLMRMTK